MSFRPLSFRTCIWCALAVGLGPVLVLNFLHARDVRRQWADENREVVRRAAVDAAGDMGRYLESTRLLLVALSFNESIRQLRADEASGRLRELREASPVFANLLLFDQHSDFVAGALPAEEPLNVADRAYAQRVQTRHTAALGEFRVGNIVKRPVIHLAYPVPGSHKGEPIAFVVAALDLGELQRVLEAVGRAPGIGFVLLDRRGAILAQSQIDLGEEGQVCPGWETRGQAATQTVRDRAGREQILCLHAVPGSDDGLWVAMTQLQRAVRGEASYVFITNLVVPSLFMIATALLALWVGDRLLFRPVRRLTLAAAALAEGRWSARAAVDSGAAELRALGRTFDTMAEHVHQQLAQVPPAIAPDSAPTAKRQIGESLAVQRAADAALRRSEATARAFIDSIPETAVLISPDAGRILMANEATARRFHRRLSELIGVPVADLMPFAQFAARMVFVEQLRRTRLPVVFDDDRDGLLLHTQVTPVLDDDGTITALAVISFDITERRRMEEQLRHTIGDLEKALAEVKTLSGLLPICACCKKIRDDKGYWNHVEQYLRAHTDAKFSHGICPDCMQQHYPEYADKPAKPSDGTGSK